MPNRNGFTARKAALMMALASLAGLATEAVRGETFQQAQVDSGKLILHERDIKPLTVWEWGDRGVAKNAVGERTAEIPADAAKIELQLYNFPTVQIRKIYFPGGTRTPWHANLDDIVFYGIDAQQVEFVGKQTFDAHPGDVTLHPSGVEHHSETLGEGSRLEFAFDAQDKSGRDLIALSARDMTLHEITEWVENGQRLEIIGATGHAGGKYRAKLFYLPAYALIEAHFPAGERIAAHTNAEEKVFYVVNGRLKVTTDGVTDTVEAGSVVRMVAGKPFAREALTDSTIVELPASKAPRPYPR